VTSRPPARCLVAIAAGAALAVGCATTAPREAAPARPTRATARAAADRAALAESWLDRADRLAERGDLEGALACADAALALVAAGAAGDPSRTGEVEDVLALAESLEDRIAAAREAASPEEPPLVEAAAETAAEAEETGAGEAEGEPAGAEAAIAAARAGGIPVVVNRHVRRFLDAFVRPGELRRRIERGFARGGPYLPIIRERLRAAGLPEELALLPVIESGFSTTARSRAGARGMWQFMPSTARLYGLRVGPLVDERRDPIRSTEAAIAHLADLHAEFGDWYLALAAYNSGAGNVRRAIRRARSRDFWRIRRYLPRETRDYVPAFLAAVLIARDPDAYGVDPPREERWAYDEIEVPDALDLGFLAQRLGVPVRKLRELNPALRYGLTPARTRTRVRVPEGMAEAARAALAAAPRAAWAPRLLHTVRRGESLYAIARRYGSSVAAIRRANHLRGSLIRPGQRLVVPRGRRAVAVAEAPPRRRDRSGRYTVQPGDTLWEIARAFGTTVDRLAAANGLRRRSTLRPGQRLVIPEDARRARRGTRAASGRGYRVRPGDTLYGIARRFGVSVRALKRANGLRSNLIRPGQRLTIPGRRAEG